ncbi:MAG: AIR synthase-related protein [Lentisphaeria bacterium]|nr:AIR synthase-related protein [Lentisphaeria bacterium]
MLYRIEVSPVDKSADARAIIATEKINEFLNLPVQISYTRDVYTIGADLSRDQVEDISQAICNPIIQEARINEQSAPSEWILRIGFSPGVTDNVARSAANAIEDLIGRKLTNDEAVFSCVEYLFDGAKIEQVQEAGEKLLGNPLIQSIEVFSSEQAAKNELPDHFPQIDAVENDQVDVYNLHVSDDELVRISEQGTLALTLDEMKAIQQYFIAQGKTTERQELGLNSSPTDVELEVLAQTWSEHCKHKIFDAIVDYEDTVSGESATYTSLYKTFIKDATSEVGESVDWLRSVFTDNAGVIGFNDEVDLVYKVETHNSPSALDPYGGAMTGIVGVNRDPMGTGQGANLLGNVWGYCLASPYTEQSEIPEGLLHPRIIRDGVHLGVIEGGNQSGIPYTYGWEYFDDRFLGKPLVFCGTIGTLPVEIHGEKGYEKEILPGDLVVMTGGRIGKDGIHGATFSSEELHKDSPVQAVQIGDPITQKKMYDFIMEARDRNLFRFITDNGAGGLSSSIGEMATECDGVYLDLSKAPTKYAGLQPWEILLSEAQERMSFAIPKEKIKAFQDLSDIYEVEVSVLGEFRDNGKFHMAYKDRTVAYMDIEFMHKGYPRMQIPATWVPPVWEDPVLNDEDAIADFEPFLGRLNLCSGEAKARQYDHEVKGLSVIKPYVGINRNVVSDATVFMIEPLSSEGVIVSAGVLPRYSDVDTYHMTASVIDLSVRRIIAIGGKLGHIAGLDNFCWPDPVLSSKTPDGPYKMAQLVRSNQALKDICTSFTIPLISGKDSMKNDSTMGGKKISIPPTLLFSAISKMDDISKAVTLDSKDAGDLVYIIGETKDELGGSEYLASKGFTGSKVPQVDVPGAIAIYKAVSNTTEAELCKSLHTPAVGGLAAALAKVSIGGDLGLEIDLDKIPQESGLSISELLYSESNSRFIATIAPENKEKFESLLAGIAFAEVGTVTSEKDVKLSKDGACVVKANVDTLLNNYESTLAYE